MVMDQASIARYEEARSLLLSQGSVKKAVEAAARKK